MDDSRIPIPHIAYKVKLCGLITFHGAKMVEMLLKHVEQHTNMGTVVHVFQLMSRQLIHDDALRLDFSR